MNFFQNSVLNKYLKAQDALSVKAAYTKFTAHFHDPAIQENIRNSKEEQYQGEFLIDLFVNVLGYTKNPKPGFNLTTEYKNVKDSKKADGAILLYEHKAMEHAPSPYAHVIAVIELKGTETTDLNRIEAQAFGYKNNQPECVYVITSNFEKLRFYIDNAIEHIEFNLFTLTEKEFELLWLCLAFVNIGKNLPKRIKDESVSQEDVITKSLYNDYSLFKRELHQNLVALNPDHDPLTLFKKSQKLLDRFLFLFFAEDRQLLPPNSVRLILDDWRDLQDREVEIALYARFKKYFEYLNTGFKGKRYDVFAYNGGLFKTDALLDALKIEDELLYRHAMKLSTYDFVSEVDVNILGHIFENSLNELDEIKAQLEGRQVDKSKSKRKKDGVFYTPKYITKYIVDNTVGKLCTEKKAELGLIVEEYTTDRKRTSKTKQPLFDKLSTYRNWLLQLTICDPACGSGAFLNQALDFLINEHRYIDELQAKLFGDTMVLSDFEKNILENNLFGVDLNEESVEIAKLSLWLRTAQPNRKLNDLNNNIKCGNSLIDDPAVAGDKAFNWQQEFPSVFPEKAKKAWHITTATHNSRYSQRMFDYHVQVGDPVWLSEKEEIIVTETIAKIVIDDKLNVLAYNICGDHMHLVLVCEDEELPGIMQKIKSMSARACNISMGRTIPNHNPAMEHAPSLDDVPSPGDVPLPEKSRGTTQFHLWTQKFGRKEIVTEEQLNNTIVYVQNNRIKHQLSANFPATESDKENSVAAGLPSGTDSIADEGACSFTAAVSNDTQGDGACSIALSIDAIAATFTCSVSHALRTEYKGGFDVVIGNPPYVQLQSMGEMSDILKNCGYETFEKGTDLYCIFTERGYSLLKNGGKQSFIMPNKWMVVAYGKPLRKFLSKTGLCQVLNFGDIQFFQEATTYVCIFVTQKNEPFENVKVLSLNQNTFHGDFLTEVAGNIYDYPASKFGENEWSIQPYNDSQKLEQMKLKGIELKDLQISINYGIKTGYNDAFFIDEEMRHKLIAADAKSAELIKPMVRGRDVSPYGITDFEYLIGTFPSLKLDIEHYPAIKKHLLSFGYDRLKQTGESGARKKTNGQWFETQDSINYHKEFAKPKIIYPNMTSVFPFMYDESGLLSNDKSFILTANDDSVSLLFLTAVFNSSLAKLWIWYNCPELQGGTREIRKVYFEHFPVPQATEQQTAELANLATERTRLTASLETLTSKFQRTIQRKFNLEDLPGKLQNWYQLTCAGFIAELAKKKVKLSLTEEAGWEAYFLQEKNQALAIKSEIVKTDSEIDRMVYQLYGLTEEEIRIVAGT
jgi:type I restriction-modification system DNA methylase subunit/REP element-mobilizing transposase RayT